MGRPNILTLFTENGNLHDENNSDRSANFYCAWHGARKKRLHSQLLEFLNTNNILWDQWVGSGPPHPAQLLRLQTGSDCAASQHARPRASLGDTVDLWAWEVGRVPGAGRCKRGSSLPAGRGRPRSSFRGLLPGAQLTCSAELGSTPGDGLSPVQSCPACHGPSRPNASGRLTSRNGRRATGNSRLPLKSLGFVLQPAASHRGSNAGPRVQQDASEALSL